MHYQYLDFLGLGNHIYAIMNIIITKRIKKRSKNGIRGIRSKH